jgi:predicted metalloprotease
MRSRARTLRWVTTRRRGVAGARALAGTLAIAALGAACGVDVDVRTVAADPNGDNVSAPETPPPPATPPDTASDDSASDVELTTPSSTTPPSTAPEPVIGEPQILVDVAIADVVDVGDDKPGREHDAFVAAALVDIERWWSEAYPEVYGGEWEPLAGGVYAGYPGRDTDLPGCGEPVTSYPDLNSFAAFYCQLGDFMMYDDGDDSLLTSLAGAFGPAVMGVVLSHEYGHAIQARIGALDEFIATIYTEQQADCFSGAWIGQAYRGESPIVRLGDADIRAGLVAMLEVRDPVGTNQFADGGHGSAFDRVGAFQEGFLLGPARCAELLDDPLTLMPNEFQPLSLDEALGGNAPYDCEELRDLGASEEAIAACVPAPTFLADDLNDFWNTYLDDSFPDLTVQPVDDLDEVACEGAMGLAQDAILCPADQILAYDEPDVLALYREFGDFTLGYFYGIAWAEIAQRYEGSAATGEQRALLNDCYTGAWTGEITPDASGNTPRQRDTDGDGQVDSGISSSPGDLDEAIRMAILVGDPGATADVVGSPFEKIAAFRVGVLGGLDACRAQFGA